MRFPCCDPRRLDVLRAAGDPAVNAIEFLEVLDRLAPPEVPRQRTLLLRLLRPGFAIGAQQLRIDGGERIRSVGVLWTAAADALPPEAEPELAAALLLATDAPERTLVVRTDGEGDFSRYTLRLLSGPGSDVPPADFDPRLARVEFSFKVECPSEFDCAEPCECPPEPPVRPAIDYLARDYAGFRRLMLDRLSLLVPGWTERSVADLGVTLVEVLAYAADQLTYRQDVVATEAYLGTARRRSSVRRHARLVDYRMHDGCNARAWVQVQVSGGSFTLARGSAVFTRTEGVAEHGLLPFGGAHRRVLERGAEVFEVARTQVLDERCNRIALYTWGDGGCCLPVGSTAATLRGRPPLAVGDVLVLEEVASPTTDDDEAALADADRARRWAVRLTQVDVTLVDPSGGLFDNPPTADAVELTGIAWDRSDALPFALCLGSVEHPGREISVARGNIVLADHGRTVADEPLPPVPGPHLRRVPAVEAGCGCETPAREAVPVRFRPVLAGAPVTQGFDLAGLLEGLPVPDDAPPDPDRPPFWPASQLLALPPRHALPQAVLSREGGSETWTAAHDLLASTADGTQFVVETEHDGQARLRFGDGVHGRRPAEGDAFHARYRVGNGGAGNVGAEALAHVLIDPEVYAAAGLEAELPDAARVTAVRNPLAAAGGVEPEDVEVVRRDAPEAFRVQERAVTAADYAEVAGRSGEVQRAAASFRWTGSWHTVFVTADRPGGAEVDAAFEARLRAHLERYRMAGYDLEVDAPRPVPLDIALHVCVAPGHFRAPVLRAVRRRLSSGRLPDGSLGLFHPDRFSFGDPVHLSRIVAEVQAVPGVEAVRVDRFGRLGDDSPQPLQDGVIPIGRLEIAQLAHDPNFPERGVLTLVAGGGL